MASGVFIVIKYYESMDSVQTIARQAAALMREGGTILYPTDTVWGLGCDARNENAIEVLYEIKERPHAMSMLVLVESIARLEAMVGNIPFVALQELQHVQRSTTLIYPNVVGVARNLLASDGSLGIRLVTHPLCVAMISALDAPIVSTSANLSGHPTATNFDSIETVIKKRVDWIAPKCFDTVYGQQSSRILKIEGDKLVIIRD